MKPYILTNDKNKTGLCCSNTCIKKIKSLCTCKCKGQRDKDKRHNGVESACRSLKKTARQRSKKLCRLEE